MKIISKKIFSNKSSQLLLIFLIQGISAVLGFAVQFLLARNMTVSEYGQFSILFNAVAIISLVVSFGSSNHILRYISIYNENRRNARPDMCAPDLWQERRSVMNILDSVDAASLRDQSRLPARRHRQGERQGRRGHPLPDPGLPGCGHPAVRRWHP